ncbi:MAG: nucleotidyl transferase AbiEii/AbiGii toxin family protein [Chlamydiales bacterium]
MIPKKHILQWSAKAPWFLESQIEQDLVLSRIIVEIFSEPYLAKMLAFRGGTALHKMFLQQPERYSEDIDLVMIQSGAIGQILDAIRSKLDPWLGDPRRTRSENRVKMIYKFETESQPVVEMRIKIEINTIENFSFLGYQNKQFSVESPWFSKSAEVTTYSLEELLGTKLRALYQRKKGRDLFDLAICSKQFPGLQSNQVIDCFQHYLTKEGNKVSRAEFEANIHEKISDPLFLQDIMPLLPSSVKSSYEIQIARDLLQQKFLNLLPGEPWKGN